MKNNSLGYDDEVVKKWIVADRSRFHRDNITAARIEPLFMPGPILELGSGTGQLAQALIRRSRLVIPSDASPDFVEHMRTQSLNAQLLDVLADSNLSMGKFDNILARGLSPLISNNMELCRKAYKCITNLLSGDAHFIFVFPRDKSGRYSTFKQHCAVRAWGGLTLKTHFRHQVFPSRLYGNLPIGLHIVVDKLFGWINGMSDVLLFTTRKHELGERL